MREKQENTGSFECVQPELGNQIWLLELADTNAQMQTSLENHLAVCDSCRLTLAVQAKISQSAQEENAGNSLLNIKYSFVSPSRPTFNFTLAGTLALAASLALALIMPPGQMEKSLVRGDGPIGFISPVEGEVLLLETPQLSWTAVPGATSYLVEITGVGNSYQWQTQSSLPSVNIPAKHAISKNQNLRAVVQTVPDDLVPLGSISVSFKREGVARFFAYRITSASLVAKLLGLMGLISIGWGYFRTRPSSASLQNS